MQIRHWLSVACLFTMFSAVAYAGFPVSSTGGKCDDDKEETQAGVDPGDGGKDNSDPVYLASGDFQRSQTDLYIPGRGLDFEFKRMYRSRSSLFADSTIPSGYDSTNAATEIGHDAISDRSPLGIGWQHKYNMRIDLDADAGVVVIPSEAPGPDPEPEIFADNEPSEIYLYDGTGRWDVFDMYTTHDAVAGDPALYSNEKFAAQFRYSVHNAYIDMFDENQIRYRFLPFYTAADQDAIIPYAGRLQSITDQNGNQLEFFYETSNGVERLASMTDTLGHPINFYYHDDAGSPLGALHPADHVAHLLWQVVDHANRVVEFNYENVSGDYEAKLISVTLPSIENTTDFPLQYTSASTSIDHGRFTSGRTWQYEYAAALTGGGWLHNGMLTKVTDPNGVVIVQNTYDLSGYQNPDRREYGRVIRQQYGDEAYNYVWIDELNTRPSQTSGNDYFVWVNDRRGAITRFKYSGAASTYGPGDLRDMQLLEKTEWLGFVDNPDLRVFAEVDLLTGNISSWWQIETNGTVAALSGAIPHSEITTTFTPNDTWNTAGIALPSGSSSSNTYKNHDYPLPPGFFDDPRFNKTVTSWTMSSPDDGVTPPISITEYWRYDFDLGGSGCGCGSSGHYTAYKDGKGNVTRKVYDTTINSATGRANGNLLAVYRGLPASYFTDTLSSNVSNDAASVDEYTYNQWGQVLTHKHPKKVILDSQGNETTHRRVDQFEYYTNSNDEANNGRLHKQRIDVNGFDLTTTYEYDLIGNVIKDIDPGGDVKKYLYNQASQLVRVQHFDDASNRFAEKMFFYDANGNMVVEEELNLDGTQNVGANKWFTTVHVYDKLDYLTETSREKNTVGGIFSSYDTITKHASSQATNTDYITQRWTYDGNRNLTKIENGEAVRYANGGGSNGGQESNVIEHEYDARDLRIQTIVGAGGTSPLKTKYVYNDDNLLITQISNPDELLEPRITSYFYDGINRVTSILDPMDNEIVYEYDNNHNTKRVTACGPVGEDRDPSQMDTSITLAEVSRVYDRLNRYTTMSIKVFDYSNPSACDQLPSGSQLQTMAFIYNDDSSIHELSVPSGEDQLDNVTEYFYDTVSRLEFLVDAMGNISESEYDSNSRLTKITQTNFSSETPTTTQMFHLNYAYDALDRQTSKIDGVGNDTIYAYDSRSNLIEMTDARDNVTSYIYDALGRRTQVNRELSISESSVYDDSNRLISEADDNGNTTEYEYDGLYRVVKVTMPDGAFYSVVYDANGNPATYTDARGVVIWQTYDLNNRLEGRTINDSAVSGGIPGSTFEDFTYDGLGRLLTAVNDFTLVNRAYDSRSNVLREVQNPDAAGNFPTSADRVVEYNFDLANNNTQIVYPSGRSVYRTHDELNRLVGIFNDYNSGTDTYSSPVTEFEFIGRRVESRIHGNGTRTGYKYNGFSGALVEVGDKGFGGVRKITTTKVSTNTILDAFTFTWDETQNRTSYKDTSSGMDNRRERTFGYDELNRLISTDVNFPDPNTDFPLPTNSGITTYSLDGVHNRTAVSGFVGTGSPIGNYEQTGDQAELNQYSLAPRVAGDNWAYFYDANGNMTLRVQDSPVDYNGDYTHNNFDISAFQVAYSNGDPEADHNGDGQINSEDVTAFLADYNAWSNVDLEHWHYTYDFRNQLVEVASGFGAATPTGTINTYDALARRVLEQSGTEIKQMVYGGVSHWELFEQIDLSQSPDVVLTTHVYGLGIDDEVSYRIEDLATPEDIWAHRDDLNSLTSITDVNGDVKERYEYGDFGKVSVYNANGNPLVASSYIAQHLYTGCNQIGDSGLYDMRFRALDAEMGRFTQRDPLGFVDTMNVYVYVSTQPYQSIDTYGLDDKVIYSAPMDNLADNPVPGSVHPFFTTIVNIIESTGYGYETHSNVTLVDVAKDLITRKDDVKKVYLSGHGCSSSSSGGVSGARFRNPNNGGLDVVDADLLEKLVANQKCPKDKRNPTLSRYYNILNAIFNNTDEVDWFSCNTFIGSGGQRFQDALRDLGWDEKSTGHHDYVGDPDYLDGRGGGSKNKKPAKPSSPIMGPPAPCGGCPPAGP